MPFWIINFKYVLFVSVFVFCAANKSQLGTVCEERSTITQLTSPEILKWHAVLVGIHDRGFNRKITEWLGVSLMTVWRIWKELNESNADYEVITAWKHHYVLIRKKLFNQLNVRLWLTMIYSWRENNWIHTFPKGISAMWNAISHVQDLNLYRRVHFLWR